MDSYYLCWKVIFKYSINEDYRLSSPHSCSFFSPSKKKKRKTPILPQSYFVSILLLLGLRLGLGSHTSPPRYLDTTLFLLSPNVASVPPSLPAHAGLRALLPAAATAVGLWTHCSGEVAGGGLSKQRLLPQRGTPRARPCAARYEEGVVGSSCTLKVKSTGLASGLDVGSHREGPEGKGTCRPEHKEGKVRSSASAIPPFRLRAPLHWQ